MLGSILIFILILSILILVHELGHFLVAKKNGILVEEFGFGLPPRIFGKKIGETIYSINLLPFGGFVRLHGEMTNEGLSNPKRAFLNKSKKVKIAVIIAGVIMNFILAVIAFAVVYSHYGIPREKGFVEVAGIIPDTPASESKIIVGERIFAIDGKTVTTKNEVTEISVQGGKHVLLVGPKDKSENEARKVNIKTEFDQIEKRWYMGFLLISEEAYFPPIWQRPFYGSYYGFRDSVVWGKNIVLGLVSIFSDLFKGDTPQGISGPFGVYAVVSEVSQKGSIWDLINLVGIISVNLAIINILPFPALDGGRLLFIVIEKIVGRKILPKIEAIIHSIGMIILMGLIIAITIHDIKRLISAGSISNFLESMVK